MRVYNTCLENILNEICSKCCTVKVCIFYVGPESISTCGERESSHLNVIYLDGGFVLCFF